MRRHQLNSRSEVKRVAAHFGATVIFDPNACEPTDRVKISFPDGKTIRAKSNAQALNLMYRLLK